MKLVFIPAWVEAAFKTAGLPLEAVLDPTTLQSTLSGEDVGFYIHLNQTLNTFIPPEVATGFEWGTASALSLTEEFIDQYQDAILAYASTSGTEIPFRSEWFFGSKSDSVAKEKIQYFTRTFAEDTVAIFPSVERGNTLIGMVDDLLFHLNSRLEFTTLAKTPIFRYYLTHVSIL
jgi:hypothetical protein